MNFPLKTISILSLGAGVQSTALALMAERGMIEKPVAAIFADTGAEPAAVYRHVEWIRSQVSFPIYTVREGNGIEADFLAALENPSLACGSPPFFVRDPDMNPDEIAAVLAEPEPKAFDIPADIVLTATNLATGEERELFALREPGEAWLAAQWHAWHTRRRQALQRDAGGMLWRKCTEDYKIIPIRRKVRELMAEHGASHVRQLIGISTDERQRENASGVKFITNVHPLLDLGWNRFRCETWLWEEFGIRVPKSACRWCPYRSNAGWRWQRDNDPDEWELSCQFDESLRAAQASTINGARIVGQLYVHRSFTPLRTAILDDAPYQLDFGFEQECQGMCGY